MESFKEVTSGMVRTQRIADNGFGEDASVTGSVPTHLDRRDPRDQFTKRVIERDSYISTGLLIDEQGQYRDCADEYLAQLLSGIFAHVQNPSNKELIREVQLRLVTRGADDRGGQNMTKPTLEGLEQRLEQLERDIKEITGIDPQQVRDANQGR